MGTMALSREWMVGVGERPFEVEGGWAARQFAGFVAARGGGDNDRILTHPH